MRFAPRLAALAALAVAACSAAVAGCDSSTDAGDDFGCREVCGACVGTVADVVDGDTVDLFDGTRLRYLGVNTPETLNGPVDCYGAEAKAFNTLRMEGQTVHLGHDFDCKGIYGRTLAYIYVGDRLLNLEMLEQGYGRLSYPDGLRMEAEFRAAELKAKTERRGGWAACGWQ